MHFSKSAIVPLLTVVLSIGVSIWAVSTQRSTMLDACVLVSSVIWVWLSANASLWNFPVGIINAGVTATALYGQKIYADATLYCIYLILMAYGWWEWKQGKGEDDRPIQSVAKNELLVLLWVGIVVWFAAFYTLRQVGGYNPIFDGLGFASSICAQYLLSRKYIQNWHFWLFVNTLYTGLFIYRGNLLFTITSIIFLAMSFVGLLTWRNLMQKPISIHTLRPGQNRFLLEHLNGKPNGNSR